MSFNVILTADAIKDEADAYEYYENIRLGLGEEFLLTVETYFKTLSENPFLYAYIDNMKILRDVKIARFPYVIIFEIAEDKVIVYSVFNTSRRPA